jgi:hypothetical protein
MTEKELIDLGFKRFYVDENSDEIDEKLVDKNNMYYWYKLHIKNDVDMYFESISNEEAINDNWSVDFGWDEYYELNGFKIKSIESIKSIIDLFKTIKLR